MADHSQWPDWITAVSTALTAIAAGAAGIFGYVAFRRESTKQLPLIETTFKPIKNSKAISLHAVIRNRLTETIVVNSLMVTKPLGFRIGKSDPQGMSRDKASAELPLDLEVEPLGSILRGAPFDGMPDDTAGIRLLLFPPENWSHGLVKLEFCISSKALTIRDKRIVIKRRISAIPATHTDANAKSNG